MPQDKNTHTYQVHVVFDIKEVNKYGDTLNNSGYLNYQKTVEAAGLTGLAEFLEQVGELF